jgi:prophage antirepressor-like protein
MGNLGIIEHAKFGLIQTQTIKNEPWFCASDVCRALDFKSSSESVLRGLDDDEKMMRKVSASSKMRNMWFVNESGLYNLIFRSNKPEAKTFRKWVTGEVLPAIRRTGSYSRYTYQKGSNTALGSDYQLLTLRNITKIKSAPLRKHMTEQLDFFIAQLNLPEA